MHIDHAQTRGGGGEQEVWASHPGKSQVSIENSNWTPSEIWNPLENIGPDPIPLEKFPRSMHLGI